MQIVCESFDKHTFCAAIPDFQFTIGGEENGAYIVALNNFRFLVTQEVSEGQISPVCFNTSTKLKIGCFKSKSECLQNPKCQERACSNINKKKKEADSDTRRNMVLDGISSRFSSVTSI